MFRKHKKYPELIQFKYHLSCNFEYKIPRECRGLILNEKKKYEVVACPYFKFFDYNDKFCDIKEFDWESAQVF